MEKRLMLGNEAVARAAYEAGATVATAYPGTPSTEITENIAKYDEIYCEWSPNEKVALEVAIGASIAGARAICSMKHVGLNVAADPLFTASYTGVNGGLVIVAADDPGMHSSQNEQDSRYYGLSAKVPILEPSDSRECLLYVKEAFEISEEFDTPVIIRLTTRVAHSRSLTELSEREVRAPRAYIKDAAKYVMMPAMARARHLIVEKRMAALEGFSDCSPLNAIYASGSDDKNGTGNANDTYVVNSKLPAIITSGISWQYTREALSGLGLVPGVHVNVIKLGLVHPAPKKMINDFLAFSGKVLIVEELSPFIENAVRTYGTSNVIYGKNALPAVGELTASLIRDAVISKLLPTNADTDNTGKIRYAVLPQPASYVQPAPTMQPTSVGHPASTVKFTPIEQPAPTVQAVPTADLPVRPPVLCPGCPHRSVFYVLKKLKLTVCGDIGCYTLGALPPLQAIDTCICMGASIGMAHGFDKADPANALKTVAVIGDSTFLHSGVTGLMDVVYNKGNSTVMILDNEITGMTGHQHNPSTGQTIRGGETFRVDFAKLCAAIGVESVRVEDAFDVAGLEAAVREETQKPGPSVIIVKRPCVFLKSYKPESAVKIDSEKCVRCKMCMGVACAAISDKGGAININRALCARCGLCKSICRFGAIVADDDNTAGGTANG